MFDLTAESIFIYYQDFKIYIKFTMLIEIKFPKGVLEDSEII